MGDGKVPSFHQRLDAVEAVSPALAKRGSPVLRSRDATGEGQ